MDKYNNITSYENKSKPIVDLKTNCGEGVVPADPKTDFSKGLSFKSVDGREWATMEQVTDVNRAFYDSSTIQSQSNIEEEPRHHR